MSRVVVNEIEAKVGNDISFNDTVKIDTIKGKTTAGSVSIQGEGTATTNLQQGVAKVWVSFDGTATDAAANDSFNLTSMTDNGTGNYTVTINNDFSAATYACASGIGSGSGGGRYLGTINDGAKATGSCGFFCLHSNTSSALDAPAYDVTFHGDLA
tara:strand:- start:227 stop:694 length:468 start_codon:yes stop_codon:yes gene_type:complete